MVPSFSEVREHADGSLNQSTLCSCSCTVTVRARAVGTGEMASAVRGATVEFNHLLCYARVCSSFAFAAALVCVRRRLLNGDKKNNNKPLC